MIKEKLKERKQNGESPNADLTVVTEVADQATTRHPLAKGFVLGVVVAVVTAIFIVQNRQTAELDWLWFDFEARQWLALLVAFIAGGIASPLLFLGVRHLMRQRAEQRQAIQRFKRRGRRGNELPVTDPEKRAESELPPVPRPRRWW